MEWVLLLNGKMTGSILVQVLKKSLKSLNKIHVLSTCMCWAQGIDINKIGSPPQGMHGLVEKMVQW